MEAVELERLVRVARGLTPASGWIRGGKVLNVFTGELEEADVVLSGRRIAAVGARDVCTDAQTEVIDATGLTLVPGYFEPHAHSCLIYNPQTFAEHSVAHGTTAALQDNLQFFLHLSQEGMEAVMDALAALPLKSYWWSRLDPQLGDETRMARFTPERLARTLARPDVLQAGEFTGWRALYDLDPGMVTRVAAARASGKRMEAHNPGASVGTLTVMAAAGMTACHESISAKDVWARVRLGYHAALRNSSIRPDLGEMVRGLLADGFTAWDRLMFTTDGSSPYFLREGSLDVCIRIALEAGLQPAVAYRMAAQNAAAYYGLDADLGSISPGRIADIALLDNLYQPTPRRVVVDGRVVAEEGRFTAPSVEIDWAALHIGALPMLRQQPTADWFTVLPIHPDGAAAGTVEVPVVGFKNAVITSARTLHLPVIGGDVSLLDHPDCVYAAVIDRTGQWISTAVLTGLGSFDAVASSHTMSGDLIVLGRDKQQMATALSRVLELQGAIVVRDGGQSVFELELPMFNIMSVLPMDELITEMGRFDAVMRGFGYTHEDPVYSLLFLSATHLPAIRLTQRGVYEVKTERVLSPSRALPQ